MKKSLMFLMLLVIAGCSAQKQGLRSFHLPMLQEADLMFVQEDYHGAAVIYDNILEANPAHPLANLRAGICRLNMRDQQREALGFLERAQEQNVPEATYYIGLALHFHERFDDALDVLEQYLQSHDQAIPEPEVQQTVAMVKRAQETYANPRNHRLTNLGERVNSPYPDYMPLVSAHGGELYFTSRRKGGISDQQDPNGAYFEDVYHTSIQNGKWQTAAPIGAPVNSPTHDATVALSPSGNSLLIYRTNASLEGGDIYLTTLDSGGWTIPEKFTDRINSPYFEPSATIASDERTIYFASNRPGGYGGKDIYRVVLLPDGNWSFPINLGPTVNTSGHEDGPFISADGSALYFSSTGHRSIGGYDILKSEWNIETNEWDSPQPLGYPINTVFDDIYLVMEASGRLGYYSTNREGGYGGHDIYQLEIGSENAIIIVAGRTLNEQRNPLKTELSVTASDGSETVVYQSNARTGKYVLTLQPGIQYQVNISCLDCETIEEELQYEEIMGERLTEIQRDFVLKQLNQQSSNE